MQGKHILIPCNLKYHRNVTGNERKYFSIHKRLSFSSESFAAINISRKMPLHKSRFERKAKVLSNLITYNAPIYKTSYVNMDAI